VTPVGAFFFVCNLADAPIAFAFAASFVRAIFVFNLSVFLFFGIVGVCFLVWSIVLREVDHGNLSLFLFLGLWVCVVLELHFASDVPTTMVQHEGGGTSYTVDYDSDAG
jgi:hypothetical protein